MRPLPLLATLAGFRTRATHKITKLMHKVQIVGPGATDPRMMPFATLVVLARHNVHRCCSLVSTKTRSNVKIKEDIARLQAGAFTGA